jgi:hypothetical protein
MVALSGIGISLSSTPLWLRIKRNIVNILLVPYGGVAHEVAAAVARQTGAKADTQIGERT